MALIMLLFSLLVLQPAQPADAQTGAIRVRLEPGVLEVGEGQDEMLSVYLENADGAYAIDIRGSFDPSIISGADKNDQSEGIQMAPGPLLKADFLVRNGIDNDAGTFQYVVTQVNPTEAVIGSGVVLQIHLHGKSLGQESAVKITFVEVADRRGNKLPVEIAGEGLVRVVPPKAPTPTPVVEKAVVPTAALFTPTAQVAPISEPESKPIPETAQPAQSDGMLNLAVGVMVTGFLGGAVIAGGAGALMLARPDLADQVLLLLLAFWRRIKKDKRERE